MAILQLNKGVQWLKNRRKSKTAETEEYYQVDNAYHYDCKNRQHEGILHLPPSPRELIKARLEHEGYLLERKIEIKEDFPLPALYRMYEHFVLGQHDKLREEFEAFWRQEDWNLHHLPNPRDVDPERYACLAAVAKLLMNAFNDRIEHGIPRHATATFTREDHDKWKAEPKKWERNPDWVRNPRLNPPNLFIPHWDDEKKEFVTLAPNRLGQASPCCYHNGVVVRQPQICFT